MSYELLEKMCLNKYVYVKKKIIDRKEKRKEIRTANQAAFLVL